MSCRGVGFFGSDSHPLIWSQSQRLGAASTRTTEVSRDPYVAGDVPTGPLSATQKKAREKTLWRQRKRTEPPKWFPSGKWLLIGEWRKNETKSIRRGTNTTTPEILQNSSTRIVFDTNSNALIHRRTLHFRTGRDFFLPRLVETNSLELRNIGNSVQ